ncbi:MAG: methionine biosynthesis protein MetW [Proteobacteria bacterium]|nr:methionine biosynthesis protein MetW [Pseudomonadota bacterium]
MTNNQTNKTIGSAIRKHHIRYDLEIIADFIKPKSKVLDIGCGNGELLEYLVKSKEIDGRGLEISQIDTGEVVKKGISVIHGDAQKDLAYYPDNSFDYAILSQTIQAMHNPKEIMEHCLRIAEFAIISLPNFAYFKNRFYMLLKGQMPVSETIPYQWYETPGINFCSIKDFENLCKEMNFEIKQATYLTNNGKLPPLLENTFCANFLAEYGVFLITKNEAATITESEMIFKDKSLFSIPKASAGLATNSNSKTSNH